MDHIYVRAWGRLSGLPTHCIEREVLKARLDRAPETAIYQKLDGSWVTFDQIESDCAKEAVREIAEELERHEATEREREKAMKRVKELLMRQMKMLGQASSMSAECLDCAYLAELSQAMAAVAAEMRQIEEPRQTVRLATTWPGEMQGGERDERRDEGHGKEGH